jgi:hypothetical protein
MVQARGLREGGGARVITCGTIKRAIVVAQDGNRLTYLWPCGYKRTETLMTGPRGMRQPASEWQVKFFSRYWSDGVSYPCPRCKKAQKQAQK